jgi:hypothetical protein
MICPSAVEAVSSFLTELGLPVKSPKSLFDGTIKRFENWHKKNVNSI